jgi:hypothetical protein
MRIVHALRDREQARRLLDPTNHALVSGSPEQIEAARRERVRHQRIASIFANDRLIEIPRDPAQTRAYRLRVASPGAAGAVAARGGDGPRGVRPVRFANRAEAGVGPRPFGRRPKPVLRPGAQALGGLSQGQESCDVAAPGGARATAHVG